MMNELNNTSASNEINVTIGAVKLPDGMIAWEGLNIHLQLTDRACSDLNASDLQTIKFALPLIAEKVETWVKTRLQIEDQRRAERKKAIEVENAERLKDFEAHLQIYEKQMKAYEDRKAAFEKKHEAWEKKVAQMDPKDAHYESEPKFYASEPVRPQRPHLQTIY